MRWFARAAFSALVVCALTSSAAAQYVGTTAPLFPTLMVPMFPGGTTVPFTGQSSGGSSHGETRERTPSTIARAYGPPQIAANATALATHFAPDARAKMKATYLQSFDAFKQFERKLDLTDNDVANGVSAYIAGNYMVLHGIEVDDGGFVRLVTQVRHGLQQSRGFQAVPAAQKRRLYEQTAMVGMFMAVVQLSSKTTAQDPNVRRNLQDSARANLQLVLGKSAANLRIDGDGMHL